jgi:hypothetical protein
VDTRIADAYMSWRNARSRVDQQFNRIYHYVLPRRMQHPNTQLMVVDGETQAATMGSIKEIFEVGAPDVPPSSNPYIAGLFDEYDQDYQKMVDADATYREESERYEGWSRFFMVPDGHIHSSMGCPTCNKMGNSTRFNWLPQLSGLGEADAVAEHGAVLCTVCFPSAPVEYTNQFDLEKAARAEKRCPGSGAWSTGWGRGDYCPECHVWVSVTRSGKMRAHNRPES